MKSENRPAPGLRPRERERERGAIAVLMALCLTFLLGFAAIGFDLSYVRLGRLQMENATDAAAHAAVVVLRGTHDPAQAKTEAAAIAHLHEVLGKPMKLTDANIDVGVYDFTTNSFATSNVAPYNAVRINSQRFSSDSGDGLVNLTFGAALGYSEADVTQSVTTAFVNRYFQIEMDVTDSYLCDLDNATTAATDFLTWLAAPGTGTGTPGDWIGLDAFTGAAREVTPMKNAFWKYQEILDDPMKLHGSWLRYGSTVTPGQTKGLGTCNKSDDPTPSKCYNGATWSLTAEKGGWRQCPSGGAPKACDGVQQFPFPNHDWMPACDAHNAAMEAAHLWGGTDLAEAINVGRGKLNPAALPGEPKVLVLITDGVPMACTGPGGGGLCGTNSGNPAGTNWQPCCANGLSCDVANSNNGASGIISGDATATGAAACTRAKAMVTEARNAAAAAEAEKIDLFVIGFFPTGGAGAAFADELHKNRGTTANVTDTTKFYDELQKVPNKIPLAIVR
jgi:Flp pilus assembly protein TadG